jgi:hypothetical protein
MMPGHLRFDDDVTNNDLKHLSCFKASSPAHSLNSTTDNLCTVLGLAGFKDALHESLVQEINNVQTLKCLWSCTDVLKTTLKGIDPSLAICLADTTCSSCVLFGSGWPVL